MTEELKPCPFCGSHDVEVQGKPAILDALDSVSCNECTADAPYPVWNTRSELKAGQGEAAAYIPVDRETGEQWEPRKHKGSGLMCDYIPLYTAQPATTTPAKFHIGDRVRKTKGSQWSGVVVGTYSTALTPEGYAVESSTELGSVQIYPAQALEVQL